MTRRPEDLIVVGKAPAQTLRAGEEIKIVPLETNMDPLFQFHMVNDGGKVRAQQIAESFDTLLRSLQDQVGSGVSTREFSICKTKLEEACFYAKKAMATQGVNQQQ